VELRNGRIFTQNEPLPSAPLVVAVSWTKGDALEVELSPLDIAMRNEIAENKVTREVLSADPQGRNETRQHCRGNAEEGEAKEVKIGGWSRITESRIRGRKILRKKENQIKVRNG